MPIRMKLALYLSRLASEEWIIPIGCALVDVRMKEKADWSVTIKVQASQYVCVCVRVYVRICMVLCNGTLNGKQTNYDWKSHFRRMPQFFQFIIKKIPRSDALNALKRSLPIIIIFIESYPIRCSLSYNCRNVCVGRNWTAATITATTAAIVHSHGNIHEEKIIDIKWNEKKNRTLSEISLKSIARLTYSWSGSFSSCARHFSCSLYFPFYLDWMASAGGNIHFKSCLCSIF